MAKHVTSNLKSRTLFTLVLGFLLAVSGLLVYALPVGFSLEEEVALDFLFNQRQQDPSPENVILVSINNAASQHFDLVNDPARWPRELHARLIDTLSTAGAAVIAFDVFFHQAKDNEQDMRLANAMRQAGNVLIFSKLHREVQPFDMDSEYNLERLILPLASFNQAAADSAPFVLPKVPVLVNQFWTFHTSAGGTPSLPSVALEYYVAQDHSVLLALFSEFSPHPATLLKESLEGLTRSERVVEIRHFFKQQSVVTQKLLEILSRAPDSAALRRLQALLALYIGPDRRYLNFYGPPQSIPTLSYHDVLSATEEQLAIFKDKVVFVGFAEAQQPEQKDSFYTVFSQESGLDISGVEIAATAFANLLRQENLRLPEPLAYIAIIAVYGLLLAWLSSFYSTPLSIFMIFSSAVLYTLLCLYLFTHIALWLPLFIPVLVQTPLALFIGLLWRHRLLSHERRRIRQAFGYYLPDHVVEELAHSPRNVSEHSEQMFGVCLASDAAQYTELAESLTPKNLSKYMHNYYERLFKPVREHGGTVTDVVGDAMLAIWSARQPERRLRYQACVAALQALRSEQVPSDGPMLRTRMGLHAGEIMMGNIGALDHYEYRAMGDIVNTASRIEGLNKQLGTSLLVSDAVLEGLDGLIYRELGLFRMVGKQTAISIYELLGLQSDASQFFEKLCEYFSAGLHAYQNRDWQAALNNFQQVLQLHPNDGPSRYYIARCDLHIKNKLSFPQDGVIVLQKK